MKIAYNDKTVAGSTPLKVIDKLKNRDHVNHNKSYSRYVSAVYRRMGLKAKAIKARLGLWDVYQFFLDLYGNDILKILNLPMQEKK